MPEKQTQPSETVNAAPEKSVSGSMPSVSGEKDARSVPESADRQCVFKRMLTSVNAFLDSMDEEEPDPPQGKPYGKSDRDFSGWCRTVFLRVAVFSLLFALAVGVTIFALGFGEKNRIPFFPPDGVMEYLTVEHENLEAEADRMMSQTDNHGDIPFERFDAKLVETVKPLRIYCNGYGICFLTSKDWCNGEHGVFIAKDTKNMPPDMNWGLIEGRIYTYVIYN